jgi:hypothetical protein
MYRGGPAAASASLAPENTTVSMSAKKTIERGKNLRRKYLCLPAKIVSLRAGARQ